MHTYLRLANVGEDIVVEARSEADDLFVTVLLVLRDDERSRRRNLADSD